MSTKTAARPTKSESDRFEGVPELVRLINSLEYKAGIWISDHDARALAEIRLKARKIGRQLPVIRQH